MASSIVTRVDRTARELADLSLEGDTGRYLGSEDELLRRVGVSRPTLRQAAKLVANDRLITVRRGPRGGLYADRPDAADSVRAVARYLRLNGATLHDVFVVNSLIAEQAGALAANLVIGRVGRVPAGIARYAGLHAAHQDGVPVRRAMVLFRATAAPDARYALSGVGAQLQRGAAAV